MHLPPANAPELCPSNLVKLLSNHILHSYFFQSVNAFLLPKLFGKNKTKCADNTVSKWSPLCTVRSFSLSLSLFSFASVDRQLRLVLKSQFFQLLSNNFTRSFPLFVTFAFWFVNFVLFCSAGFVLTKFVRQPRTNST